jgi:beta-lactamase regulating signal transducer with metallopeptidase domain
VTDWLLGTLAATSGLMLLVLIVREPVRRHFGAGVAYSLWLIPAARLLMPTLTKTVERRGAVPSPIIPAAGAPELSHLAGFIGWPIIVLSLWLVGAFVLFITRVVQYQRQRMAVLAAAEEIERIGSIRIVRSAAVRGPVAFGIADRIIAVPIDFEARYSEQERLLALHHEIAHHRSGDLIANFFAFVLLCLQWFNPVAWLAHAAFRFDQEAACDARVLEANRSNRADYGRAIAKTASGRSLLLVSALDRRSTLHRRLKCMIHNPTASQRMAGRLMVYTAIAAALPLTASRAIEYVDEPSPSAQDIPADPRSRNLTLAAIAADTARRPLQSRPEQANIPPNRKPEFVEARVRSRDFQPEIGKSYQVQSDEEKGRRDVQLAQQGQEQIRREADQARRDREQARRDTDQASRDREQARREADQAFRDLEQIRREADQARRDKEQARREADQARRDQQRNDDSVRRVLAIKSEAHIEE